MAILYAYRVVETKIVGPTDEREKQPADMGEVGEMPFIWLAKLEVAIMCVVLSYPGEQWALVVGTYHLPILVDPLFTAFYSCRIIM